MLNFDKTTGTLTIDQNFRDNVEDGIVAVNTNRSNGHMERQLLQFHML